jgi:mono/diheme cytochrome c family protein
MIRGTLPGVLSLAAVLVPPVAHGQDSTVAKASSEDQIYEGWRQYSVHCARCHGQDVLGNPVAANLLVTVGPGGSTSERDAFVEVVNNGRPERGMPGLEKVLTPEQTDAIYQYVRGRAEKKVPPGRPKDPQG